MDQFAGAPAAAPAYSDDEAIQRAIISEHGADATYRNIAENTTSSRVREVIQHIREEEQEHQGMLQALLIEIRGGDNCRYEQCFCAGLEGQDKPEEK